MTAPRITIRDLERAIGDGVRTPDAIERARAWIARMKRNGFRQERGARFHRVAAISEARAELPVAHHARMWRKPRVGLLYTAQPYDPAPATRALALVEATCRKHDLHVVCLPDASWWLPERSVLLVIGRRSALEHAELGITEPHAAP